MRFHSLILLLFLLLQTEGLKAQDQPGFIPPLELSPALSGTFGEPRTNHLHSGLDFRTMEKTGWPVRAVADGYVARIKVEPGGFGKALYISHPNGLMTVSAHLERFHPTISAYVEAIQYAQEQFQVDIFPKAGELPVRAGDTIAWSGNSGSSSGPHLHFEVRDDATQHILNPLLHGFRVGDSEPPLIRLLALYPLDSFSTVDGKAQAATFSTRLTGQAYQLSGKAIPEISGQIGLGIQTYDPSDGSTAYCGPYSLKLLVDGREIYAREMSRFSFDNTRYVNSMIDYPTFRSQNRLIHLLYVQPGNKSETILKQQDRGVLTFVQPGLHLIRIMVGDASGNISELSLTLRYRPSESSQKSNLPEDWDAEKNISGSGFEATIPAGALYTPLTPEYSTQPGLGNTCSALHTLGPEFTPLHKRIQLSIRDDSLPEHLRTKALLVMVNKSSLSALGGAWEGGMVTGSTFSFGTYAIATDTVPPSITPLFMPSAETSPEDGVIRITVTDDLSGIASFVALIDGQWALFDYDAKNNLFVHTLRPERTQPGQNHQIDLSVRDAKDNLSTFTTSFYW
jgi:hypothetical protein